MKIKRLNAWLESLDSVTQWVAAAAIGAALTIGFIGLGYVAPLLWDALPADAREHPVQTAFGAVVGIVVAVSVWFTFRKTDWR